MTPTPDHNSLIEIKRLSASDDYYNMVFKKTERIASAVFYILSHIPVTDVTRVHHQHLSDKAMALHVAAAESLTLFVYEAPAKLYPLQHALVVVGSALSLAAGARVVSGDIVHSVDEEIDAVLRYLKHHYMDAAAFAPALTPARAAHSPRAVAAPRPRRVRPNIPVNDMSSDAILVYSDLSDRTTRIKTVLEAKPDATIKDLTDIITDVSAKTIQRDLNSLIESGEVIRQGERRWSKYSLAK